VLSITALTIESITSRQSTILVISAKPASMAGEVMGAMVSAATVIIGCTADGAVMEVMAVGDTVEAMEVTAVGVMAASVMAVGDTAGSGQGSDLAWAMDSALVAGD
jgi:hypothetical protein